MSRATTGRIVQYTLSQEDADAINRRRTTGGAIAERINDGTWVEGAQAVKNDLPAAAADQG